MAPVYDFRHVELDKIGRGKRIVKPPGGECSNIFASTPDTIDHVTPRKTNNYMQSSIFTPDSPDSPQQNGHSVSPAKVLDTQNRLFGESGNGETPRRVVNRQRSSIFEDEVVDTRPQSMKTGGRRPSINPITGTPVSENGGSPNGYYNGESKHNGSTPNGHTNGYSNGHSSPESPMSGTPRIRNPPGGKSSGIF